MEYDYDNELLYEYVCFASLIYGIFIIINKHILRTPTHYFEMKNKTNVDHLSKEIESLTHDALSTTHIYKENLSEILKFYINNMSYEVLQKIGNFTYIPEITEIYYTARTTQNSDNSFTNLHTDSPFHFFHTYRALICIEDCEDVTTIIPEDNIEVKLKKYDILAFDYANALHYIKVNKSIGKSRIVIKLHYSKSQIGCLLTKRYTRWARSLYVHNLKHITLSGYIMLWTQFLSSNTHYIILMGFINILLNEYYEKIFLQKMLLLYPLIALYQIGFQLYFVFNDF